MTGIITKALSGFYYVTADNNTYECKARGNFRKSGISPLVGDKTEFEALGEGKGVINKIIPRKNCISRPAVANIDKLFIISSFENPAPNTFIIDKMIAIAEFNYIEPIIVFNKSDMGDFSEIENIYKKAGFKTFIVSAKLNHNLEALEKELENSVCAFTGNSGVGKSSILNAVLKEEIIPTGEISEKLGRGRHTTRHTEIYPIANGGFVADTPGFSSLEADIYDYSFKEQLPLLFRDFADFTDLCRFSSCTHTCEKNCAVIEAVENGKIAKSRFDSYLQLFEETKDLKPWQAKNKKRP